MELELCINCHTPLLETVDSDPNGDKNAVCARCRAEEKHDFDKEPDAKFDRSGRRIEPFDPIDERATYSSDALVLALQQCEKERDALKEKLKQLREASRLRRNTIIDPSYDKDYAKKFAGLWIAVPYEDFKALRSAQAEIDKG